MTPTEHGPRYWVRRRMRRWILGGCIALGLLWWWHQREPRYQGHSLSSWLDTYDAILSGHLTEPGFEDTRTALRHFGKDGLSYYIAALAYETPHWQLSTLTWVDQGSAGPFKLWEKLSTFGHEHIDVRNRRAAAALLAFELLGPDATPAVSDLERLASSSACPRSGKRALSALSRLGPEGLTALARIVLHGEPGPSAEALRLINELGADAGPARLFLARALGTNFSANPAQYYRLRLQALEDAARFSNAAVRIRALRSLAAQGRTEILFPLLSDTNLAVRSDTTNILSEFALTDPMWSPSRDMRFRTNAFIRGYNFNPPLAPTPRTK